MILAPFGELFCWDPYLMENNRITLVRKQSVRRLQLGILAFKIFQALLSNIRARTHLVQTPRKEQVRMPCIPYLCKKFPL